MRCVCNLFSLVDVDLKMLHYQYPGFEHYDVLCSKDTVVGMQASKRNTITHAIRQSSLLRNLMDGNVQEYRRNALLCVGIVADSALLEEESVDTDSNNGNSQHSIQSSEEEASSSDSSDSEVETPRVGNDGVCFPPGVPTPLYPRCRGMRFCAGYNIKSHCPDGVQSGLPPDVPIPLHPRTQETIFYLLGRFLGNDLCFL